MEITHVIRGEDHISNTPRQVLLYQALGFAPAEFAHLSLVLGPDHTPLSKRHGATSVAEFRERGYLPEALTNYLALIGWSPGGDEELMPMDELARRFALEDVGHSAGVFDPEKLAWMNRHYMKMASPARLAAEAARYFQARGFLRRKTDVAMEYLELAAADGGRLGRSARGDSGSPGVPVRFRSAQPRCRARRSPGVLHEPGAREVIAALPGAIEGPLARSRRVSRDGEPCEGEDRAEGQGALPSDPRRADRRRRRPRARPRRAGDRSRRAAVAANAAGLAPDHAGAGERASRVCRRPTEARATDD